MFIDVSVVALADLPRWVGFDANLGFQVLSSAADRIGVVSGVSDDRANIPGIKRFQQPSALGSIAPLSGGENEVDQLSTFPRDGVDFCRQSTTTSSETTTIVGVAFFSPASRRPVEAV